jgi:hypothetical protein
MNGGVLKRISKEDLNQLIQGWESWAATGRVKANNPQHVTHRYDGCQPLLYEFDVDYWLGSAPDTPKQAHLGAHPAWEL